MATYLQKDADDPTLDIALSGADRPALRIRGASDSGVPVLVIEQVGAGSALSVTGGAIDIAPSGDITIQGTGDILVTAATGREITLRAQTNDDSLYLGDAFTILDSGGTTRVTGPSVRIGESGGAVGFYATTPIAKQTGVAVTAAAIHAALVALGLIGA